VLTVAGSGSATMPDMTLLATPERGVDPGRVPLDVEIAIPVYNEAAHLAERIAELRRFLDESFPFRALVTIVDNASTDDTMAVATELAATLPGVVALHLSQKGRGHALRTAWSASTAPVVAYMDVDLSTSLSALVPLVAPLLSGHRDIAIGTRLARGSHVVRGPKRELISRAYNLFLKLSLRGRFSDAQCGFKALRREAALQLLPLVEDDEWFFDTELLITAERLGLRMSEVPVDWVDDPDSRVKILHTAMSDLRGVWRISHGKARQLTRRTVAQTGQPVDQVAADQLMRFAGVGAISTLGYLFLFIAWRPLAGTFGANALALAICTIFNLAVHKELARSMQGHSHRRRFAAVAAGLFVLSVALTSLGLLVVQLLDGPSLGFDLLAVTVANAVAAVLRFAVLRAWVFRPHTAGSNDLAEASS
jgi:putative flippase GtrA